MAYGIVSNVKNFYIEVRLGNIPGYSIIHKFGRNVDIANGIWSMVSSLPSISGTMPTSGSPVRVKIGGSVVDTANGAGAREITVVGIDTNLNEVSETLVTTGAGASSYTTANFWRVYRAYVSSVGTYGGNNTNDIVIENVEDVLIISANEGQTQHAAYSIPINKVGYLLNTHISVDASKAADIRMFTRSDFTNVIPPFSPKRLQHYWDGIIGELEHHPISPDIQLNALSDIWFEAEGSGQNTEVSVDFEILLVDDDPGHLRNL